MPGRGQGHSQSLKLMSKSTTMFNVNKFIMKLLDTLYFWTNFFFLEYKIKCLCFCICSSVAYSSSLHSLKIQLQRHLFCESLSNISRPLMLCVPLFSVLYQSQCLDDLTDKVFPGWKEHHSYSIWQIFIDIKEIKRDKKV